ncbi:hypothetical protein R3P38DRAFT_2582101 [Favolaschia claudopus]|uniref:Uncharacterized protein n=1 Tax=Favolaschia claudopus TaxID=2862362 RepID=A0AAV9ZAT1_9AGAR
MERKKLASKDRRRRKRQVALEESDEPHLKEVHRARRAEAEKNLLHVDVDSADLPHSKPAWIGKLLAEDGSDSPISGRVDSSALPSGLGPTFYTQEEIDSLTGTENFCYLNWLGEISIPILDSHRRLLALLGGKPRDLEGWQKVTDDASRLLDKALSTATFPEEKYTHRRAHEQTPYPTISRGVSYGGGQVSPGELCNTPRNERVSDELLQHECFQRISGFSNCLFRLFAPALYAFYQAQLALLSAWNSALNWPFLGSVFAACTFNLGPRASTRVHLDFGNLAWGWCAITALGWYDPDKGGHLILWDLKLIIRFPPGSTILIPSAILRHSNVPVGINEKRFSFTQYTAGGLFRWIRNGFQTDAAYELNATSEDKAARKAEAKTRWQTGVDMFRVVP